MTSIPFRTLLPDRSVQKAVIGVLPANFREVPPLVHSWLLIVKAPLLSEKIKSNMKILLKVLGTIFAVVALLVCLGGVIRNMSDAEAMDYLASGQAELQQLQESMKDLGGNSDQMDQAFQSLDETANGLPSKGEFQTAGALMAILGVISLALIVFQYTGNVKINGIVLALTLIVGVLAIMLSPVVPETLTGGMSNRTIAIIAVVPAIAAAITAFLVARMKKAVVTVS
jgi:hypothetical protein